MFLSIFSIIISKMRKQSFILILVYSAISNAQILYPNTGFLVKMSSNSLSCIQGDASGWTTNPSSNPTTLFFNISSFIFNKTINAQLSKFKIHKNKLTNNSYCYYQTLSQAVIFKIRSTSSLTDTVIFSALTYFTNFQFSSEDLVFYQENSLINKLNLTSNQTTSVFSTSSYYLKDMVIKGPKLVIWLLNGSNMAMNMVKIADLNGIVMRTIYMTNLAGNDCQNNSSMETKIEYDEIEGKILRVCLQQLQVWSQSTSTRLNLKVVNISNANDLPASLLDGIFCGPYLVVATSQSIVYYNKTNWSRVSVKNYIEFSPQFQTARDLICTSTLGHIGFVGFNSTTGDSIFYNSLYDISNITANTTTSTSNTTTNTTPNTTNTTTNTTANTTNTTTNTTNSTNTTTNTTTNSSTNITANTSTTPNVTSNTTPNTTATIINSLNNSNSLPAQFNNTLTANQTAPQNQTQPQDPIVSFNNQINRIINSQQFRETINVAASFVGIFETNFLFRQLLKPLLYLFDEFWLYKFHLVPYTEIFQIFTNKTDIFVSLRIKPKFLEQMQIGIPEYELQNDKYFKISPFSERGPDQIFMLQSLKDVYTFSLFSSLSQFIFLILLKKIVSKVEQKGLILRSIYRYLQSSCIWWGLLISFVETNMVVTVFYISIQIQCFFSFNYFSKINLILSIFIFTLALNYSYVLYHILFRYEEKKFRSEVLTICKFNTYGFWLQMSLNCLRRFHCAFFHGIFINSHFLQLLSLIILDATLVITVMILRKQFKNKFIMIITLAYFAAFLCLDSIFFLCTQFLYFHEMNDFFSSYRWNFVVIVLVLIITAICVLQTFASLYISMKKMKNTFSKSEQNSSGLKNLSSSVAKMKKKHFGFQTKDDQKKKFYFNARPQELSPVFNISNLQKQKLCTFKVKPFKIQRKTNYDDFPEMKSSNNSTKHTLKNLKTQRELKTLKVKYLSQK